MSFGVKRKNKKNKKIVLVWFGLGWFSFSWFGKLIFVVCSTIKICDDIFSLLSEQKQQLHQQRLLVFTLNLYEFELSK